MKYGWIVALVLAAGVTGFFGVSGFYDGSAHGDGVRHVDTNADFVMDQVGLSSEGKTGLHD